MLLTITLVNLCNVTNKGVVGVTIGEQGGQGQEDLGDGQCGGPLVFEDIQTDPTFRVDVAVVDLGLEGDLGGCKGVVGGEGDVKEEQTLFIRGTLGANDPTFPVENIGSILGLCIHTISSNLEVGKLGVFETSGLCEGESKDFLEFLLGVPDKVRMHGGKKWCPQISHKLRFEHCNVLCWFEIMSVWVSTLSYTLLMIRCGNKGEEGVGRDEFGLVWFGNPEL